MPRRTAVGTTNRLLHATLNDYPIAPGTRCILATPLDVGNAGLNLSGGLAECFAPTRIMGQWPYYGTVAVTRGDRRVAVGDGANGESEIHQYSVGRNATESVRALGARLPGRCA